VASEILTELYARLGYDIEIRPMAAGRAAIESTSGQVDGDVGRIRSFNADAPDLIRVPTPFYRGYTAAFVRMDSGIDAIGKEDLPKYRVARIRGVVNTNLLTEGVERVTDFGDLETMFRFLELGRADVAVTNTIGGGITLSNLGMTDIGPLEPPLETRDFYHFIHRRHEALVPTLDALIREMTASGELGRLTREIERKAIAGELPY